MGIFSGLFKSRDKPQNRTAGSNYAFFMGGTTSGKTVTERSAMQMTAVYSCVRILSEAVAGLPLHLYKYTDSGGKAMALDHNALLAFAEHKLHGEGQSKAAVQSCLRHFRQLHGQNAGRRGGEQCQHGDR